MDWTYKVIVKTDSMTMAGFLDMLRYDRVQVIDWTYGAGEAFIVTIKAAAANTSLTTERWESFGLYPRLVR
jgi:hypothetical protein